MWYLLKALYSTALRMVTMAINRWSVSLCCWASTAAIAAEASFPNVFIFDFKSCSFASAASSLYAMSGWPVPSLSLACRLDTSTAYLSQSEKRTSIWQVQLTDPKFLLSSKQLKTTPWTHYVKETTLLDLKSALQFKTEATKYLCFCLLSHSIISLS